MIKGKTKNGFDFVLEDDALNDWELMEDLADLDSAGMPVLIKVMKSLLGEDQYKKAKEHVRGENGRVSVTGMSDLIQDIFEATAGSEAKNSSPSA